MFMCAAEWVTLGLNIPLLFYHLWRYFHRPADGSEVMYDPVSIMNADILNYCQKESWCKLAFYLLSFFYYLYRVGASARYGSVWQPTRVTYGLHTGPFLRNAVTRTNAIHLIATHPTPSETPGTPASFVP